MRVALVVPIDPDLRGNGLAHRARFWRSTLEPLGELTTIVIPVAGPAPDDAPDPHAEVVPGARTMVVAPEQLDHGWHPALAQLAPEYLGARLTTDLPEFDLIVGLRSYLGPFCIGLRGAGPARIVVDLDDDDATFHASTGDDREAERYTRLVEYLWDHVDLVASTTGFDGTASVPNSVDLAAVADRSDAVADPPQILMVGNFGYGPNVDGARWFAAEVLPLVHQTVPDAVFLAVGPQSHELSGHGIGFVDDLGGLYASACLAVVPILAGSGSRIKALEAWAHVVPVVGTTVGLDGLDADSARAAFVADTPGAFAEAVVTLLTDRQVGLEMGARGRTLVERRVRGAGGRRHDPRADRAAGRGIAAADGLPGRGARRRGAR